MHPCTGAIDILKYREEAWWQRTPGDPLGNFACQPVGGFVAKSMKPVWEPEIVLPRVLSDRKVLVVEPSRTIVADPHFTFETAVEERLCELPGCVIIDRRDYNLGKEQASEFRRIHEELVAVVHWRDQQDGQRPAAVEQHVLDEGLYIASTNAEDVARREVTLTRTRTGEFQKPTNHGRCPRDGGELLERRHRAPAGVLNPDCTGRLAFRRHLGYSDNRVPVDIWMLSVPMDKPESEHPIHPSTRYFRTVVSVDGSPSIGNQLRTRQRVWDTLCATA